MEKFEELIAGSMLEQQIASLIKDDKALDAVNQLWPQVLKDKENPTLNKLLGIAYLFHGDVKNARLYLGKALELEPEDSIANYYMSTLTA